MKKDFDIHNSRKSTKEAECSRSWNTEQKKSYRRKNKEGTSKASKKKAVLWIRQPEQVERQVTTTIQILMRTKNYGSKKEVVKRKILECVRAGEKVMLRIQMNKWKGKLVKRKRLKHISVTEKVTL